MFNELCFMLSLPFMLKALFVGLLISLCAGLLGVSLVLRRYSMIGDGLSHVGFGAVVVGAAAGIAPLAIAIPIVIIAAFLLLRLGESSSVKGDAAVAIVSAGALSVGILASSLGEGMNQDFNSYMFGSIYGLSNTDIIMSICVSVPVLILFFLFYNKIFAVTFDETFSKAAGVKADFYNGIVALLTSLVIVLGMRLIGALLISSFVIFPSLISMRVCKTFKSVTICSGILSVTSFILGFCISAIFNLPTGATIVILNIFLFIIFYCIGKVKR